MELLPRLGEVQSRSRCLPRSELEALSHESGKPLGEVLSVASFYSHFTLEKDDTDHIEHIYPCRVSGALLTAPEPYAWTALENARRDSGAILPAVEAAGLLGRSGGAFPTAKKWALTKAAPGSAKYVVCNADEGEPFTGKDRALLERNPKSVIEGMAVCALAVGAKKGFLYLRGEYADLREKLESVIAAAPLGDLEIEVYMGHGAYVCGDETALLNSLEGRRGETRLKPPYPGVAGYLGCPTVVNNVETFACVPYILNRGAEAFRALGCADYPGSKLYTLCGAVKAPGVYELPSGCSIGQLLSAAGGPTEPLRAVLTGGGSGTLAGPDCLDAVMSPRGCASRGLSFGTASLYFVGAGEDPVRLVRELTAFFSRESCGVCAPCRVGLRRLLEKLEKLESGRAWPEDVEQIQTLADEIRASARCALGQAAVTPALSLLKNFPEVVRSCQ